MEKTNIRYLTEKEIKEKIDFCVSNSPELIFLFLYKMLSAQKSIISGSSRKAVCLFKAASLKQEKAQVKGKKGVVREPKIIHKKVIFEVCSNAKEIGFGLLYLDFSPVKARGEY